MAHDQRVRSLAHGPNLKGEAAPVLEQGDSKDLSTNCYEAYASGEANVTHG
jgi:hypothetical protein